MVGRPIKVWNRTDRDLTFTKDGLQVTLTPGENMITADQLHYAKYQNPVPGSEDPGTLEFESLVSFVADPRKREKQIDPLDTIPWEVLQSLSRERINRSLLPSERQQNIAEFATAFPRKRVGIEKPTAGFTDPGNQAFGGSGAD